MSVLLAFVTIEMWGYLHAKAVLDNGRSDVSHAVTFGPGGNWILPPGDSKTIFLLAAAQRRVRVTRDEAVVYEAAEVSFRPNQTHLLSVPGPGCYLVQTEWVDFDEWPPPLKPVFGRWIRSPEGVIQHLSSCP